MDDEHDLGEMNHFPHPILSALIIKELRTQRASVYEILENQKHKFGYGQKVPETLITLWQTVKQRLEELCVQWEEAVSIKEPKTQLCDREAKEAVRILKNALMREKKWGEASGDRIYDSEHRNSRVHDVHVGLYTFSQQAEDNMICHEQRRFELFEQFQKAYFRTGWNATAVDAYRAIWILQEYTRRRGWSTDEGSSEMLAESMLAQTQQDTRHHMNAVVSRMENEFGRPSKPITDFQEVQRRQAWEEMIAHQEAKKAAREAKEDEMKEDAKQRFIRDTRYTAASMGWTEFPSTPGAV